MEKKQLNVVIKQGVRNVFYLMEKRFQMTFAYFCCTLLLVTAATIIMAGLASQWSCFALKQQTISM